MSAIAMIREARKASGLLIREIAHRAGVSNSFCGDIFSGNRPVSLEFACRVCPILGLEPIDVLTAQVADDLAARAAKLAGLKPVREKFERYRVPAQTTLAAA